MVSVDVKHHVYGRAPTASVTAARRVPLKPVLKGQVEGLG